MFDRLRFATQNFIAGLPSRLIFYYFLFVLTNQGLQFLISQLIASELGAEVVGIHYLLLSYISILLVVTTFGSSTAIIKYVSSPKYKQNLGGQYIINTLVISLLLSTILYLIFPYLPDFIVNLLFPSVVVKELIQQANLYLILYTTETILIASLVASRRYKVLVIISFTRLIIITFFLYTNEADIMIAWKLLCLGSAIVILLYIVALYPVWKTALGSGLFSITLIKKILEDSWTFFVASLLVSPSLFIMNRILSETSAGLAALGIYTICKQFSNMNSLVVNQFSQSIFPLLNHQFHNCEIEEFKKLARRGLFLGLFVASSGFFILSLSGPLLIFPWYKWPISLSGFSWYCLTIGASILVFLNQYYGNLLVITDRQRERLWADIALSFVLVSVCVLTKTRWPYASPFIANFCSISVGSLWVWSAYQRRKQSFPTSSAIALNPDPVTL